MKIRIVLENSSDKLGQEDPLRLIGKQIEFVHEDCGDGRVRATPSSDDSELDIDCESCCASFTVNAQGGPDWNVRVAIRKAMIDMSEYTVVAFDNHENSEEDLTVSPPAT